MLFTALQTLALVITLESAIFLIRGNIALSAQSIAEISGSYWDFNPHLVRTMSQQTADTRIGAILLLIAFFVQIVTLWIGPTWNDLGPANRTGLLIGALIGVFVFATSWRISASLSRRISAEVEDILKAKINSN